MVDNKEKKAPANAVDRVVDNAIRRVMEGGASAVPEKTTGEGKKPKQPQARNAAKSSKQQTEAARTDKPAVKKQKAQEKSQQQAGRTRIKQAQAKNQNRNRIEQEDDTPYQAYHSNKLARFGEENWAPAKTRVAEEQTKTRRDYKLRIIPLGGLGEVGKNMMVIQYGDDMIVVDGGLTFPDGDMYGVDLVIPDYSFLIENQDKLRAFILTHGHEDHIGAMPFILNDIKAPVYGAPMTLGLLKGKLEEHRVKADMKVIRDRQEINIGPFRIEFIRLTHSIPDTMGAAIHTPVGTILIITDFKIDMSPIDGKMMDFGRISALGEKGVLLLMSDSTNVEKEGFTDSERSVGYEFDKLFFEAEGRIVFASFASHVHRVQQAIWAAERCNRKIAVCGRGMQNMFNVAGALGYLKFENDMLIDIARINDYRDDQLCIITTGSQGELLSGLSRMAMGEHRQVQIRSGDTVVISATPIPGNERTVSRLVDSLFRKGAKVIYERFRNIHVSGHASKAELLVLLNMVRPRFFMPVHGEYRMLFKHAQLAHQVGVPEENTIIAENGQVVEMNRNKFRINGTVPSGRVFVDGLGVGDVGASVLRERRQLSEGGFIVVSMIYRKNKNGGADILFGPEITTRGFIFEKEYEHIIGEMKQKVEALATEERLANGSLNDLRNQVKSMLTRFINERTRRRPVIVSVIEQVR